MPLFLAYAGNLRTARTFYCNHKGTTWRFTFLSCSVVMASTKNTYPIRSSQESRPKYCSLEGPKSTYERELLYKNHSATVLTFGTMSKAIQSSQPLENKSWAGFSISYFQLHISFSLWCKVFDPTHHLMKMHPRKHSQFLESVSLPLLYLSWNNSMGWKSTNGLRQKLSRLPPTI